MSTTDSTRTDSPTALAPSCVLWVSAYGGWNWDRTSGSMTRVTFEGPDADAMAAAYVASHGHLVISYDDDNEPNRFPLTVAALYPECEHGLSLSLCTGPGHYPADM